MTLWLKMMGFWILSKQTWLMLNLWLLILVSQLSKEWNSIHKAYWGIPFILRNLPHDHVLTSLLSLRMSHLSLTQIILTCFQNLPALKIHIYLFVSLKSLIHMPRVPNDLARMKFIPFAFKDDAKKCIYSLKVSSVKY